MEEAEIKNIEDARCIAVEVVANSGVKASEAKQYADYWFNSGDGLERKPSALVRAVKRKFAIQF